MAGEHEEDFDFAGGPYQGYVDDAEGLGYEGEPGAEVGEGVGGVLRGTVSVSAGRRARNGEGGVHSERGLGRGMLEELPPFRV